MNRSRIRLSLDKKQVIGAIICLLLTTIFTVKTINASYEKIEAEYKGINSNLEQDSIEAIETEDVELVPELFISHAGGRVNNKTYTNSKEALERSYENGYRFIELDFEWTTDGNLVLIHDWEGYVSSAFGVESRVYSTDEFKNFNMTGNLTQMTLEDLVEWLYEHKDIYIVTDVKTNNVEALELIKDRYPDLIHQFIPQIYKIDQLIPTRELGYKHIILTLYMSNYTDGEIVDFVRKNQVLAITMPIYKARTELPKKLKNENVFIYAHTINDNELRRELELIGVDGFYTDDLLPSSGADLLEKAKILGLVTEKISSNYEKNITREEFCELTIKLYEALSGKISVEPKANKFTDTNNPEILKANYLGIVNGISEAKFLPNANVTREEMITMLYRTLKAVDETLVTENDEVNFIDRDEISQWVLDAVGYMSNNEILLGVGHSKVIPKGNATREQAINLVERTIEKFYMD